jgi:hypothetical protein
VFAAIRDRYLSTHPYSGGVGRMFYSNHNQTTEGHIYVIKEREFIKTKENVYKIGRSKNIRNRMPSYPKDSLIYSILYAKDVIRTEKEMIRRFDTVFTKRQDIGYEYYECEEDELMREVTKMIHDSYRNHDIDQ